MTTHTDTQLKQALAKMLPDVLYIWHDGAVVWNKTHYDDCKVLDTELLHLCWLVEEEILSPPYKLTQTWHEVMKCMAVSNHATWQQRTVALAKVLNIEIV